MELYKLVEELQEMLYAKVPYIEYVESRKKIVTLTRYTPFTQFYLPYCLTSIKVGYVWYSFCICKCDQFQNCIMTIFSSINKNHLLPPFHNTCNICFFKYPSSLVIFFLFISLTRLYLPCFYHGCCWFLGDSLAQRFSFCRYNFGLETQSVKKLLW